MIHTVLAHRSMRTKALSWVCSAALLAEFYSCDGTLSPEAPRPCVGRDVDIFLTIGSEPTGESPISTSKLSTPCLECMKAVTTGELEGEEFEARVIASCIGEVPLIDDGEVPLREVESGDDEFRIVMPTEWQVIRRDPDGLLRLHIHVHFEPKAEERHLRLYVRPVESEFNDLKSKLYLCKDSELVSCPQMYVQLETHPPFDDRVTIRTEFLDGATADGVGHILPSGAYQLLALEVPANAPRTASFNQMVVSALSSRTTSFVSAAANTSQEVLNTMLPPKKQIHQWSAFVQSIAELTGARSYLEIGCFERGTYDLITSTETKACVDPVAGGTVTATSDEFFKANTAKFDLIFIDGSHIWLQVLRDVVNALECLADGGVIAMHDSNPIDEFAAAEEWTGSPWGWNGDVYKAVRELRSWPHLDIRTADVKGGVSVLLRRNNSLVLAGLSRPIGWADFERDRELILMLHQPTEVLDWVRASMGNDRHPN